MKKNKENISGETRIIVFIVVLFFVGLVYSLNATYPHLTTPLGILFIVLIICYAVVLGNIRYLKNQNKENRERYQFIISTALTVVSVLVLFGQFSIMHTQTQLLSSQQRILEETSQPLLPTPLLISSQGKTKYSLNELSDTNKTQRIAIGATNLGKITIPYLSISLEPSNPFAGYPEGYTPYSYSSVVFDNVENFEYNFTWFRFYTYNLSNLREGEYNLSFELRCAFCKEEGEIHNISICVYNNSRGEC